MSKIWTIVKKEVSDYLSNRTFLVILTLFCLLILVSAYQGVLDYNEKVEDYNEQVKMQKEMEEQMEKQNMSGGTIRIDGVSSGIIRLPKGRATGIIHMPVPDTLDSFKSMTVFIGLVGGILALVIGFDAVSGEREKRSLSVLMTMPVFRDVVINSKLVSRLLVVLLALGVSFLLGSGLIMGLTGFTPTGGDLSRLVIMVLLCLVYVGLFLGLAVLLSIKFKQSSSALLWGVIIWLGFTILVPQIAGLVADVMVPRTRTGSSFYTFGMGNATEVDETFKTIREEYEKRESIENTVAALSPRSHFEAATQAILTKTSEPSFTVTGETRSMNLGEALGNSWQHILALIVPMVLLFASSYLLFNRMDLD